MTFLKPKYRVIIPILISVFLLAAADQKILGEESEFAETYAYIKADSLTKEFVLEQLVSGAVGGAAFGLAVGYIGYLKDERESHSCVYIPKYSLYGALAGAAIGSSIGVYRYSNRGGTRGSYLATLAGATLGPIAGAGIGALFSSLLKEEGSRIVLIGALSGFPVGAVAGYNCTRKKRIIMETNDAFLNFRNRKLTFSIPKIEFNVSQMDSCYVIQQHMNLCRISF
jgi:hypothetical protein